MFRSSPGRHGGRTAAVLAAATLMLTLGGCGVDPLTPQAARAESGGDDKAGADSRRVDCAKVKCIALTFDAGPGKDTPHLLDVLKEKRVPATFFLLGHKHVDRYPKVVKRIADEGHEVANHTWSHQILTDLDENEVREELSRTQDAVEKITGRKPVLMRPPQGRTDSMVSDVSKELGLAQILWSVTAKDYSTTDSALIRQRVLDQAHRDGIILLHDIYDGTVPAVPGIIDELQNRGYTFVTVPELLAPGTARAGAVYRPEKD
ncbi:polysaccharide deacetylase family protein [Streptomyces sp. R302]|uniref:polysaccharide deacetylase family protein n=1 Tax=unclassified Streptomyces TaxID=2593676 RepID=UPI00145D0854|nr:MULTISPECIES: polysaccharide deacetylase family protein [unclassified Streptomyces]NML51926.1 polysaccharide deacetylase family protein [Streptomyces sp. R301]NML81546.1 polysaccharide deacetylase family protein [Streptomyces sp. R302]